MNETEVADLFRRTHELLEPDVGHLVATGTARGRLRRRRARLLVTAGAAAAVAVVAIPAALLLQGAGSSPPVVDSGSGPRHVAVSADLMTETLVGLLPGATPREDDVPFTYDVQRGVVTWRGVEVAVSIDSRSEGTQTTARERCEAYLAQPCVEAPHGGWLAEFGTMDPTAGTQENYYDAVRLYVPEGYAIEATGERGPAQTVDEGGGSDADRTLLRRLVLDDVWLSR